MNSEKMEIAVRNGDNKLEFLYDRLRTLPEFLSKYGEDNITIMIQDREKQLYQAKAETMLDQLSADPDAQVNTQIALNAWKPHDDRPPTDLETMATAFLNLSPSAQTILRRHINAGVTAQNLVAAKKQAEVAGEQVKAMDSKFAPPDDVGPPIVEGAQEPELISFEEAGREAEESVQEPQAAKTIVEATTIQHADDVAASEEAYKAPVEYEEGGTEGVIVEPEDVIVGTEAQTPIPEE